MIMYQVGPTPTLQMYAGANGPLTTGVAALLGNVAPGDFLVYNKAVSDTNAAPLLRWLGQRSGITVL